MILHFKLGMTWSLLMSLGPCYGEVNIVKISLEGQCNCNLHTFRLRPNLGPHWSPAALSSYFWPLHKVVTTRSRFCNSPGQILLFGSLSVSELDM